MMDLAYKLFGKEEDLSPTVVALLVCGVRDLLKVRWKKVSVFLCAQWKNFKSSHHLIKNALLIFEN
ncbi:hypothetical protein G4B88_023200 [Cannabis sativa]|uniref:Uncharacterized protein n=1 Tax=Cannabis sativa TaxID=3483 RepID=A0A7J6EH92_CANSA|nr:hypothetical protein G4B88_023200 [Cannabis sativa]